MNKEAYIEYLKSRKSSAKTNYYLESIRKIDEIKAKYTDRKPKMVLHACCALCAAWPLKFLESIFDITIFYNNSNIWPEAEYSRRLSELKRYMEETGSQADLIVTPYDNVSYTKILEPMKDEPEGFERCFLCYEMRMDEAYRYASEHGYDFFTTVMSISRQKDSQKINEIGRKLSARYPDVEYFFSDFKKKGGQEEAKHLADEHCLYRQDYCGCVFSYMQRHPDHSSVGSADGEFSR